ncbi:MAG: DUF2834 domain-containing protein [Nannocystis sp.]|nr:DUF2834 domain-containing protein [Nannocystis sp.]
MRLFAAITALVIFTAYTLTVMLTDGVLGFITLAGSEPWGMQLLLDLLLMLALFAMWAWHDAKARGLPGWPHVVLIMTGGSMGALVYLVHREWAARKRT